MHGTTQIVLEPLDLMARLAALVPKPRMHLRRYHGVFAPHSEHRAAVRPVHRGRGAATELASEADPTKVSTPRHVAISWARRLNASVRCADRELHALRRGAFAPAAAQSYAATLTVNSNGGANPTVALSGTGK